MSNEEKIRNFNRELIPPHIRLMWTQVQHKLRAIIIRIFTFVWIHFYHLPAFQIDSHHNSYYLIKWAEIICRLSKMWSQSIQSTNFDWIFWENHSSNEKKNQSFSWYFEWFFSSVKYSHTDLSFSLKLRSHRSIDEKHEHFNVTFSTELFYCFDYRLWN